jgi:flagellar motor switch protein FliM
MSQTEVEQLLASVGVSDGVAVAGPAGSESPEQALISRPDFPLSTPFSTSEMRKLRMRCEAFVTALAARLSVHLRLECGLQMTKLDTVHYQAWVDALSQPAYLTLFRTEPMENICLLDIAVRLALVIVNRELGGAAACLEEGRDLTQIETKLAAKVVHIVLAEWCNAWADILPMRPLLLRHETSGRFLNFSADNHMYVSLGLEAQLAQTVETIHLAFPQSILEPLIAKLNAELQDGQKPGAAKSGAGCRWNPTLNDMPIRVSARWSGVEISARQLADLKPGDLLPLRDGMDRQVEISLESIAKFHGQLGTSGRQMAVKIIEVMPQR